MASKGEVIGRYLSDLRDGDPVAWTVTAVIVGIVLLFCLFWLKIARDLRREDEKKQRLKADLPRQRRREQRE